MKTLLLALAVVAFVCLGSADQLGLRRPLISHSQYCFQCTTESLWHKCSRSEQCPGMHTKCYTLYKLDENGEEKWAAKGCAYSCPTPGPGERVKCCFYNGCNEY
uniref:Three-Finger Toxin 01 n=1 Tax=Boiga nigriceps TaxID=1867089 RepID=A0A6G1S2M3_9SAUR